MEQADGFVEAETIEKPPRSEDEINAELDYDVEKPARPYSPVNLKYAMAKMSKIAKNNQETVKDHDRKVAAKQLNTLFGGDDNRHLACKYLVGAESTGKMGSEKIIALLRWAGVKEFDDVPAAIVIEEAYAVVKEVVKK